MWNYYVAKCADITRVFSNAIPEYVLKSGVRLAYTSCVNIHIAKLPDIDACKCTYHFDEGNYEPFHKLYSEAFKFELTLLSWNCYWKSFYIQTISGRVTFGRVNCYLSDFSCHKINFACILAAELSWHWIRDILFFLLQYKIWNTVLHHEMLIYPQNCHIRHEYDDTTTIILDLLVASLMSPVASLVTTDRCSNVSMCLRISTKCFLFPGIVPLLYSVGNKTYYYY